MKQSTNKVLMIRPVKFNFNEETAVTNAFQTKNGQDSSTTQKHALLEFDKMVNLLQENGVDVKVFEDTDEPHTPDSIFPNNWFSTHQSGDIFLYPMCTPGRRLERRADIIDYLKTTGLDLKKENDLSKFEAENIFLEGTGSLVLDRINKIAFACLSPRTDQKAFQEFCKLGDYQPISWTSLDQNGQEIYHTNVVMGIGQNWAMICLESIQNQAEKKLVVDALQKTNHEIIDISLEQMNNFAGNVIELENKNQEKFILISNTAEKSLSDEQKAKLDKYVKRIVPNIQTIETIGGGSVRCIVAEIFSKS